MTVTVHGVLVSIDSAGVLIVGDAGAGKSECALELISRGHSLVADDVVLIERAGDSLVGMPPSRFAGLIEIRDLGICDVRRLFGRAAFVEQQKVDICIEIVGSHVEDSRSRIGGEVAAVEVLDIRLPKIFLHSGESRNLPILVETAARQFLTGGSDTEHELMAAHDAAVAPGQER